MSARWTPAALSRRPVVLQHVVLAGSLATRVADHVRAVTGLADFEVLEVTTVGPFLQVRVRWTRGLPAAVVEARIREACPTVAPYLLVAAEREVSGPAAVEEVLAWLAHERPGKAMTMSAGDHERLTRHVQACTLPTPERETVRGRSLWAMAAAHLPFPDDERWIVAATLRLVVAAGSVQGVLSACDTALESVGWPVGTAR
ncbi:hypothetical protein [Jannaschia sp. R86511]|uniref:hypothetical protein n=1 Tax=Jannaschia sp. R86511 TaxID=3093853 RepID=UPI0036D2D0A8